jgi:hypothetical protein
VQFLSPPPQTVGFFYNKAISGNKGHKMAIEARMAEKAVLARISDGLT